MFCAGTTQCSVAADTRLFLLDENREQLAGAEPGALEDVRLQELIVNGRTVGWIGFAPMG